MRELQRQRQRARGVVLEAKGDSTADQSAEEGAGEAGSAGLESTFTAQVEGGEVDPNMLRYIEEQMRKESGDDGAKASLQAEDEDLYMTPAQLQARIALGKSRQRKGGDDHAAGEVEDANRWLAGIAEVELPAEERIANIEATEAAKHRVMEERARKLAAGSGLSMVIPTNFNANFHAHRRELVQARIGGRSDGPGDGVSTSRGRGRKASDGLRAVESDGHALSAFKRNEYGKRR